MRRWRFFWCVLILLLSISSAFSIFSWAKSEFLYSVEIRNAPIGDIIRMLAHRNNQSIVVPSDIKGSVTASFESVRLEDAMQAILESHNLGGITEKGIMRIATKEILEKRGEDLNTFTYRLKYAKASAVGGQAESLISKRGSVMVDERTNALTVRDTAPFLEDIRTLISNVDQADKQVLIEGKVIEAAVDFSRSLGIQWGITNSAGKFQFGGLAGLGKSEGGRALTLNAPAANPIAGVALGLGPFAGILTDTQLSAAEDKGDLSILSRPSIVTMNNQPATIHSGVKFYVKTAGDLTIGSSTSGASAGTTNLQQIDAGITMLVTPQITVNDKISLAIKVTESQPDFSKTVDGIPSIIDNNATTTVLLQDGETTVIGGLFQLQKSKANKGVPGLHRIPIFGALFGSTTKGAKKKELLIFITPHIVKSNVTQLRSFKEEESDIMKTLEKEQTKKANHSQNQKAFLAPDDD